MYLSTNVSHRLKAAFGSFTSKHFLTAFPLPSPISQRKVLRCRVPGIFNKMLLAYTGMISIDRTWGWHQQCMIHIENNQNIL